MSKFRKLATTGLIATTLFAAVLAPTPASAWRGWQGWFGEGSWDTPAIVVLGGSCSARSTLPLSAGPRLSLPGSLPRRPKPRLRRLGSVYPPPANARRLLAPALWTKSAKENRRAKVERSSTACVFLKLGLATNMPRTSVLEAGYE